MEAEDQGKARLMMRDDAIRELVAAVDISDEWHERRRGSGGDRMPFVHVVASVPRAARARVAYFVS